MTRRNWFIDRRLAIATGAGLTLLAGLHTVRSLAATWPGSISAAPSIETSAAQQVAQAPPLPFPLDGKPVYVSRNGTWQEAIPTAYRWDSSSGFRYTVSYPDSKRTEANVTVDRMLSLAQAKQRGIATNVYDVSGQAGVEQMVNAHNALRQKVGAPPLKWSPQLASFAQSWANKLLKENRFEHRQNSSYGENLAAATGQQLSPARVVKMWGDEVADYNYASNTCRPNKVCGHYTQIVWKQTTQVGCAIARSPQREVWVCNYNPPGNYIGQKPY